MACGSCDLRRLPGADCDDETLEALGIEEPDQLPFRTFQQIIAGSQVLGFT